MCSTVLPPANVNVTIKFALRYEKVQGMNDTWSTGSFISASTGAKYGLKVRRKREVTALANGDSLVTTDTAQTKIEVNKKT